MSDAETKVAGESRVVDLGGGAELELVYIPPGTFQMGSPPDEKDRDPDEHLHTVTLTRGFYMGRVPVTQEQYEAVMGENPSEFPGPDQPAEHISWGEAVRFCEEASARTGERFRLPTEAEWEYACRAGTQTRFHSGDTVEDLDRVAWYAGNSGEQPRPVGKKEPNAWGLYDMHGNLYEWCRDWYDKTYYERSPEEDPVNEGPGPIQVLRGGAWFTYAWFCRSADRPGLYPVTRNRGNGFRVVVEA